MAAGYRDLWWPLDRVDLMKTAADLTELVGNTPLLRLDRFAAGAHATVLAKLELLNPYSVKDRPVREMISAAEERGELRPGMTLVEATSGNTGMALAAFGRLRGYWVRLYMSEIQSIERRKILAALGAELVLTPAAEGTAGAKRRCMAYADAHDDAWYANQHGNPDNRAAHVKTTAEELWRDTDGQIDALVAGLGSCGTLCGVSSVLSPRKAGFRAIGVEPIEAPMISEGRFAAHRMMGTSPGFVPDLLDRELVHEVMQVPTESAFAAARDLALEEGLVVGISSGATCWAARELARRPESAGLTIVAIVADSGQRYLSVDGLFA